ncbi:MAG: protein rep [Chloroflexota bacterium]|nr:protein rep [Chloroflexota bacterium]
MSEEAAAGGRAAWRARRFALQGVARRLLPGERVRWCLRAVRPGEAGVGVLQSVAHGGAHYGGLRACGSVWHCPVCAAKVAERRRGELEGAIAAHRAAGGAVFLLTYTVAHGRGDDLQGLLGAFVAAVRSMLGGRPYRRLRGAYGVVGAVRGLEVTWGEAHGYHPHGHVLLFLDAPADGPWTEVRAARAAGELRAALAPLWAAAAGRQGLTMSAARGLDVRHTRGAVGDYVAKFGRDPGGEPWGPGCELAKAHVKTGRAGRYTPWDLLRVVEETGESWARDRFREYATVFKGRHQLEWSKGLRDRLGLGREASDAELAERAEEPAVCLGVLTLAEWRLVLWGEARAAVLAAAEEGGWSAVGAVVAELRERWVVARAGPGPPG